MKILKFGLYLNIFLLLNNVSAAMVDLALSFKWEKDLINSPELLSAVKSKDIVAVKDILKNPDIDVNSYDEETGTTALMYTVLNDDIAIASFLLLHKKIVIDKRDKNGDTALIIACKENNIKFVDLLLDSEADPNVTNNEGNAALIYAVLDDTSELLESLLDRKNLTLNITNNAGMNALLFAIEHNKIYAIYLLIDNGIDLESGAGIDSIELISNKRKQEDISKEIKEEYKKIQNTLEMILAMQTTDFIQE